MQNKLEKFIEYCRLTNTGYIQVDIPKEKSELLDKFGKLTDKERLELYNLIKNKNEL